MHSLRVSHFRTSPIGNHLERGHLEDCEDVVRERNTGGERSRPTQSYALGEWFKGFERADGQQVIVLMNRYK
jgi:hypothetical protein